MSRAVRTRRPGWLALGLHLSRLVSPAPRPHHRRIARAVLDDAAARQEGQLFPLDNGDIVLLWQASDAGTGLAATLARLFQVDAPNPDVLLTRWLLPSDVDALLAYVDFAEAEAAARPPSPPVLAEPSGSVTVIDAIAGLIDTSPINDLLQRQTAVLITPGGPVKLLPLFREITFSIAMLEARVAAAGHAGADPFLFRHLAHRVDGRMLHAMAEDLRDEGRLLRWVREGGPALHVNLTLSGILSPGFAGFAAACQATGARVGVEIALLDACADPEAFLLARERLRLAGLGFVLDGVSHHGLLITSPSALQPDLVKLDWSRQVPEAGRPLERAIEAVGPGR
ncbi:MAG TPA: hypothetical protein VE650_05500, partial [Acetobacteraceae bacterium]|nr:hypothetical protein [Acetobacteraceae bacterium]